MTIDRRIINGAAEYILQLHDPQSGGFAFARGTRPTLMGTAYAIHTLEFLGALELLPPEQSDAAVAFMMRGWYDDGVFRDPMFDPSHIATTSHDEAYFDGETTCFVQNALDALGAAPPPPRVFPERMLSEDGLRQEFNSYDWRDPHLNSNRVMFWMAQFVHEVERHGRTEVLQLVDASLDWMDENQNTRTGLWSGPIPVSLSAAMAATFHYTFFYFYRNRPLRHLERIIDSCIELQNEDGLFSRGDEVGQTCLDYDALDLLAKASLITEYRRPDVTRVFQQAGAALLTLRNEDGGFANVKEKRSRKGRAPAPGLYHTGMKTCSCDNTDSNSFSTWFRLIAYALCQQPEWMEELSSLPVRFRRLPWLGYHDVEAIRCTYEETTSEPQRIEMALSVDTETWYARNLDQQVESTGSRYLLRLPEGIRHFALKVRVLNKVPADVCASYRLAGQPGFDRCRMLTQTVAAGRHVVFFLMGDEKIDREILMQVSGQKRGGLIEEISVQELSAAPPGNTKSSTDGRGRQAYELDGRRQAEHDGYPGDLPAHEGPCDRALDRREAEVREVEQAVTAPEARPAAIRSSYWSPSTAPVRPGRRGYRWFLTNTRRAFTLLGWLGSGQFGRAGNALLPYYQRCVPPRIKKMIPRSLKHRMIRRLENRPQHMPVKAPPPTGKLNRPVVYQDLLVESLFKPTMIAPYTPRDSYFIAFMHSYGKYLADRYADHPQSKLVSIVMPTFNREHCIGDAIRSVLAQTYANWELFIVDDCSSDNTAAVVSSFTDERIKYLRSDKNLGSAGARNAALDRISGDYITYLDSDNTIDPDFLLILVNELEADAEIDMLYCAQRGFQISSGREQESFVRFAPFHRPSVQNRNYIDIGVLMHRRSVVERFGNFNARMRRLADWDFLLRCTAEISPKAIPVILSNYYHEKADNQNTKVHAFDEALAWIDAWLTTDPVSDAVSGIALPCAESMFSLQYKVPEPETRRPVSIVIPSFEAEPYLRACVEAIYAFSAASVFELIIVDNASGPPVRAYLAELADQDRATIVLNDTNLGFTAAVNQGIGAASPHNDIVIMNNDAIVTRGWLDALQGVLCDYPDAGLIVPSQVVLAGEKTIKLHQPDCSVGRECDVNISAHHANVLNPLFDVAKGYVETSFAPFFCVYIPRSVLQQVGILDSVNGPHYRSDRLYCDMVRQCAGRRIIYTPHSKVYHLVQRSTETLKRVDPEGYKRRFIRHESPGLNPGR